MENTMRITYLGHSGFLAETSLAYYLFDYIRGTLPSFSEGKPVYVLVSHFHEDHFSPLIFESPLREKVTQYLISDGIRKRNRRHCPEWMTELADKIQWVGKCAFYSLDGIEVETLRSTDVGVAFVVRERNGRTLYHAGDLNWWYWEVEPDSWNRNMEVNYKREIDKLQKDFFDAAFLPLDPRLERAYAWGMEYFLRHTAVSHVFPMHFWEDYDVIPRYIKEYPCEGVHHTTIHLIQKEDIIYEI